MRDEWFIRGKVPMTKEEIRAVSIQKLELKKDSVLYDIGAGTGSVSVEAAGFLEDGKVYAIEQNPAAVSLIRQNVEKFHRTQVQVVEGKAPGVLTGLPVPSHAFLGGTAGEMEAVRDLLLEKNPKIRVVLNVIALESLGRIVGYLNRHKIDGEIVLVQTSKSRILGEYHMMSGGNPVYVIAFGGEHR